MALWNLCGKSLNVSIFCHLHFPPSHLKKSSKVVHFWFTHPNFVYPILILHNRSHVNRYSVVAMKYWKWRPTPYLWLCIILYNTTHYKNNKRETKKSIVWTKKQNLIYDTIFSASFHSFNLNHTYYCHLGYRILSLIVEK